MTRIISPQSDFINSGNGGKKTPHVTSAWGPLNLIYCFNHTARRTETNDRFFPWNVVRVCVFKKKLRYFSSSTGLAHLNNFAAICCLLKKNKSLSFKIAADVEALLPARRPTFKRILYLAWAGYFIRRKVGTQIFHSSWASLTGSRNSTPPWHSLRRLRKETIQGLHFAQQMPGYYFCPDTTFATLGYQWTWQHFFRKQCFQGVTWRDQQSYEFLEFLVLLGCGGRWRQQKRKKK